MSELSFKSAGVSSRTTDLTGPTDIQPIGIPAGVIGTSLKGPAFVPTTVGTSQDFSVQFGNPTNESFAGPLAVSEWLANQQAATFIRVLGIGQGKKRLLTGDNAGRAESAGFVVGARLPQESLGGALGSNPYANLSGALGRTWFIGAVMSQSISSSIFTDAGRSAQAQPVVRGAIMTPSGVALRLSNSFNSADANNPPSTFIASSSAVFPGGATGSVNLTAGGQEFVLLLCGHIGADPRYPRVITASFDPTQPNYLGNVLNTDPLKIEEAGHVLYAEYPVYPAMAVITGSGTLTASMGASENGGLEYVGFCFAGVAYNTGSSGTAPNYENFETRYTHAKTPWITSQTISSGHVGQNLFRLWAKDAGQYPNNRIKFSIENITPGTDARPYGTFDVIIRDMTDTDKNKLILEAFRSVTLDPSSDRYIAKAIGDTHTFYNFEAEEGKQNLVTVGDYASRSNFVRVEVSEDVETENLDPASIPFGMRGHGHIVVSSSIFGGITAGDNSVAALYQRTMEPPMPIRKNLVVGAGSTAIADKGLYWGIQFTKQTDPVQPNGSAQQEYGIASFSRYFPDHLITPENANVFYDGLEATPGVGAPLKDADLYNNNVFNLSNIQIRRNTTTDLADTLNLGDWSYVRTAAGQVATSGSYRGLLPSDLSDPTVRQITKFSGFFQGGFDGNNMFNYDMANQTNKAIVEEMNNVTRGVTDGPTVKAYDRSLGIMADTTEVDVQLLVTPGIRHPVITDKALLTTENRFDALYIMDVEAYDTTNLLVTGSEQITSVRYTANQFVERGINTSFGAAYFPDQNLQDAKSGTVRAVPASVAVLGAFALNDKVGYPWNAPAGFTRGAMKRVVNSTVELNRDNLDALQEARINPLASFAGSQGVTVWGQKTLLGSESALERVNVRRLLIDVRRKVRKVANRVVFEQGRTETLQRFEQLVNPILKDVQGKKGVERFLVKIDTETTTQADINNRTIRGKIYLAPTKTLEFLSVDFEITNNSNFTQG